MTPASEGITGHETWWSFTLLSQEHKFYSYISALQQYLHIYNMYIAHFK